MSLPLKELTTAIYERLSGDDGAGLGISADVFYAGSKKATTKYVAIQIPTSGRRVTKTTTGRTSIVALRCHTEYVAGDTKPFPAMELASEVNDSLHGAVLTLGTDHTLLYLPEPQDLPTQQYDIDDSTRAFDVTLRYDLHTQRT
jgi:hypothetical protein